VAFPRRFLNDDEEVVRDLRPHWWFLSGPIATVAITLVAALLALINDWHELIRWPLIGVLLMSLGWLGGRYARWSTTNFVITTDRLIFRSGVLAKNGIEIPLERVNNVIFNQSVFERVLGAGDLLIESAGESGQQRFTDIAHPSEVQNEIYRQIEANEQRTADRSVGRFSGRADQSIPDQLERLAELRDRGVITAEEFERKKAELLDRM
jgi:uncharacterized membrane protein YdbT with pleckstrin-like domain